MINGEKYRDKLLKFIEEKDAGSFTFSKGKEGDFRQCGGRPCFECGMVKERSNCSMEIYVHIPKNLSRIISIVFGQTKKTLIHA